jgi:hypothetical protein
MSTFKSRTVRNLRQARPEGREKMFRWKHLFSRAPDRYCASIGASASPLLRAEAQNFPNSANGRQAIRWAS